MPNPKLIKPPKTPREAIERMHGSWKTEPVFSWASSREGARLVGGWGSYTPSFMVVGFSPGALDDRHGTPFNGRTGLVLRQLYNMAGISMADVWSTMLVKYRLPAQLRPDQAARATAFLKQEWTILGGPDHIILLGGNTLAAVAPAFAGASIAKPIPTASGALMWPMADPGLAYQDDHKDAIEEHWEAMGSWLKTNVPAESLT